VVTAVLGIAPARERLPGESESLAGRLTGDLDLLEVSSRYSVVRRVSYPVHPMRRFRQDSPQPHDPSMGDSSMWRIAALLEWAYGFHESLRFVKGQPTRRAPSAGALYPTECFVLRWVDGQWWTHYYDFRHHVYYRLGACPDGLARWLGADDDTTIVVLGSVLWRSAQRYGARCYLYCLLEAGNVAANLALAARYHGMEIEPTARSLTAGQERQIGLRDCEGAVLTLAVRDDGSQPIAMPQAPQALPPAGDLSLQPPMLSPVLSRVSRFHRRTLSPRRLPLQLPDIGRDGDFARLADLRRSASGFTGAPLAEDVALAMAQCCGRALRDLDGGGGPRLDAWLVAVQTGRTAPSARAIGRDGVLGPRTREFDGDEHAPQMLRAACQNQAIVAGASFAVVLGVDLEELARHGHEGYRSAALGVGAACAELYREATQRSVGTTSIGGFLAGAVRDIAGADGAWPLAVQIFGAEATATTKVDAATLITSTNQRDTT
jgi:hypothetical protein